MFRNKRLPVYCVHEMQGHRKKTMTASVAIGILILIFLDAFITIGSLVSKDWDSFFEIMGTNLMCFFVVLLFLMAYGFIYHRDLNPLNTIKGIYNQHAFTISGAPNDFLFADGKNETEKYINNSYSSTDYETKAYDV